MFFFCFAKLHFSRSYSRVHCDIIFKKSFWYSDLALIKLFLLSQLRTVLSYFQGCLMNRMFEELHLLEVGIFYNFIISPLSFFIHFIHYSMSFFKKKIVTPNSREHFKATKVTQNWYKVPKQQPQKSVSQYTTWMGLLSFTLQQSKHLLLMYKAAFISQFIFFIYILYRSYTLDKAAVLLFSSF